MKMFETTPYMLRCKRNMSIIAKKLKAFIIVNLIMLCGNACYAQSSNFNRLIGKWRSLEMHFTILVTPEGDVFAQGGPLSGAVGRSIAGGGNFEFQNGASRCNYNIAFLIDGSTDWGLVADSRTGPCFKGGRFVKVTDNPSNTKEGEDRSNKNVGMNTGRSIVEYDDGWGYLDTELYNKGWCADVDRRGKKVYVKGKLYGKTQRCVPN